MQSTRISGIKIANYVLAVLAVAIAWMVVIVFPATKQVDSSIKSLDRRIAAIEVNQRRFYRELTVLKKQEIDLKNDEKK